MYDITYYKLLKYISTIDHWNFEDFGFCKSEWINLWLESWSKRDIYNYIRNIVNEMFVLSSSIRTRALKNNIEIKYIDLIKVFDYKLLVKWK